MKRITEKIIITVAMLAVLATMALPAPRGQAASQRGDQLYNAGR